MLLLELPAELFQKILVQAILARGVKRGLRLRLVCKIFSHMVQPALFETRLLDGFSKLSAVASDWYIRKDHGGSVLLHSYLMYRAQNVTEPHQCRFLDIRKVSERVCEESSTNRDLVRTIETLCWPALEAARQPSTNTKIEAEPLSPELDLLCAAAYLNLIPLAKRLLKEGHRPTRESHLFPSPMRLAAWAGNADMMILFQESLPEYDETGLRESLIGAAIRGDIKLARLAAYPPSRTMPDSTDVAGEQFGKMHFARGAGYALSRAQWYTRDFEVYQYFDSFFAEPTDGMPLASLCRNQARLGNLEMVRSLLDAGADTRGSSGNWGNPLSCACRGCHEDVVDLLLERGADPTFRGDRQRSQGQFAIRAAAAASSLTIVRKLIDHGVKLVDHGGDRRVRTQGRQALGEAVRREHTAMVKLLLGLGVASGERESFIEDARSLGLESMVEVLQEEETYGVAVRH